MEEKKSNKGIILTVVLVVFLIILGFKFIPQLINSENKPKNPISHTVTLTEEGFEPAEITVKKGDTVVFVNNSGKQASVNSAEYPDHQLHPFLNLGVFEDSQNLQASFFETGKYKYVDHINPDHTGVVTVTE